MFCFNAAVMGFNMGINWMEAVLDQFENMVLILCRRVDKLPGISMNHN